MQLFIGVSYEGNLYITDDRDALPSDLTDFHALVFPVVARHTVYPMIFVRVFDVDEEIQAVDTRRVSE